MVIPFHTTLHGECSSIFTLIETVQLLHFRCGQREAEDVEILLDANGSDALRYDGNVLLDQEAQQNLRWRFVVLLGNRGDDRVIQNVAFMSHSWTKRQMMRKTLGRNLFLIFNDAA